MAEMPFRHYETTVAPRLLGVNVIVVEIRDWATGPEIRVHVIGWAMNDDTGREKGRRWIVARKVEDAERWAMVERFIAKEAERERLQREWLSAMSTSSDAHREDEA